MYSNGITVVLTTYNRAESLRTSLTHFQSLKAPSVPWELLIVDNNSTDHTLDVVRSFQDKLPINYRIEKKPGQCEARNNGIRNGTYDLKLFTDDDVTPSPNWLAAYSHAINQNPQAEYFGGPIALDLTAVNIPSWAQGENGEISDWVRRSLAYFDKGQAESRQGFFYGGNMAFRQSIFSKFGTFDPRLGHTRTRRFAAEETYLQQILVKLNIQSLFVPDALVWHRIRPDELTIESRLNRMWWTGRGNAVMNYLLGSDKPLHPKRTWHTMKYTLAMLLRSRRSSKVNQIEVRGQTRKFWGYELQMMLQLLHYQRRRYMYNS